MSRNSRMIEWEWYEKKTATSLPKLSSPKMPTVEKKFTTYCSQDSKCLSSSSYVTHNLSIGRQLSICNCCKPFFPSLYNCQLLCFCPLALSTAVQLFPRHFPQILLLQACLLQTHYAYHYALSMSGVYFLKFVKLIFLLSPFERLHHSVHFICNIHLQHNVSLAFIIL